MSILRAKRPQIIIVTGFLAAYLLVFALTQLATSLKVFEFAFLTMAFGFAPAYFFRRVFDLRLSRDGCYMLGFWGCC